MDKKHNSFKEKQRLLNYAFYLLGRKDYSRKEIEKKLHLKSSKKELVTETLDILTKEKLIDDQRMVENLLRSLEYKKPMGVKMIRQKLANKGIDLELLDKALSSASYDEACEAKRLYENLCRKYVELEPIKRKQRILGALARRGFRAELIYKLINS